MCVIVSCCCWLLLRCWVAIDRGILSVSSRLFLLLWNSGCCCCRLWSLVNCMFLVGVSSLKRAKCWKMMLICCSVVVCVIGSLLIVIRFESRTLLGLLEGSLVSVCSNWDFLDLLILTISMMLSVGRSMVTFCSSVRCLVTSVMLFSESSVLMDSIFLLLGLVSDGLMVLRFGSAWILFIVVFFVGLWIVLDHWFY